MDISQAKKTITIKAFEIFKSNGYRKDLLIDLWELCKQKNIPDHIRDDALWELRYEGLISSRPGGKLDPKHQLTREGRAVAENLIKERKKKWIERFWLFGITLLTSTIAGLVVFYLVKRIFHQPN